jgi:hypothetical protein
VLRRIFGPKMDEITLGWRKLHNEELHNPYSSPNIVRTIKSRRMRRACSIHWYRRPEHINLTVKPDGKIHYEDLDIGERM